PVFDQRADQMTSNEALCLSRRGVAHGRVAHFATVRETTATRFAVGAGSDPATSRRAGVAGGLGQLTSSFARRGGAGMVTEPTLSSAWDQHLASEFAAQSPEQALVTMTAEPYVNVVPLMIGSRGRNETRDFYANHFLSQIPPDMETVPVSRTVGQG